MARITESFEFCPTSDDTLSLLHAVYEGVERDPAKTFQALFSSTLVAAAIIDVKSEELSAMFDVLLSFTKDQIKANPQIFGNRPADGGTLQ
ncbi:hypothetical protein AVM02_07555 [Brucella anthropi]|uniref:hypothetical protein n=1 Tax=Brucella anthropi TaxID=529 RepID=UPI0039862866